MFDEDVGENQHRRFADVLRFSSGCHLVFEFLSALSPLVSGFPHWWLLASLLVSTVSTAPVLLVFRHGVLETLIRWNITISGIMWKSGSEKKFVVGGLSADISALQVYRMGCWKVVDPHCPKFLKDWCLVIVNKLSAAQMINCCRLKI